MKRVFYSALITIFAFTAKAQHSLLTSAYFDQLPEKAVVYMGALWCSPCVAKQNMLEDSLVSRKVAYFPVYDYLGFNHEKAKKLIRRYDSTSIVILDPKYRAKQKSIQVNADAKRFKMLSAELKSKNYKLIGSSEFHFGNCLVKVGKNLYIISNGKGTPVKAVDEMIKLIDENFSEG